MRGKLVLALAAGLSMAGAAAASPAEGTWRTPDKNALIQLYDCGADVCGRVTDSDDLHAKPGMRDIYNKNAALQGRLVKGLTMMTGFKGGPSTWTDGTLYDPSNGKTYHGSITLVGSDRLDLKGCIFGPLCRTETWTRVR